MTARRHATLAERKARRAEVSDPAVVMDAAAAFLAVRPRSVTETRRRLRHLGYAHALVDHVVDRLLEMRYLDDEAFARSWVESRDRARPRGQSALRRELALKGVDRETIRRVLAERAATGEGPDGPADDVAGSPDRAAAGSPDRAAAASPDRAAAERLLDRRRASLLREPDARKRRQKAYALLARNGFDPDVCREVARFLDSPDDEADDVG